MDGYAVRCADGLADKRLRLCGEQPAGLAKKELKVLPGETIRIFTGAVLPAGTEAVIMQEDVTPDGTDHIIIQASVEPGENIRRTGIDLCIGQVILNQGQQLTPACIGLLASQGLTHVSVHSAPRVAIISTGDELIPPGQTLAVGQLYESNSFMLAALLQQLGLTQIQCYHCTDDMQATQQLIAELLPQYDSIIFSGGVSVGDHDHVRPGLKALGIDPQFWRVRIKPGKPFLFCQHEGKSLFGLPGNPVSSFVTFQLFVRPAMLRLLGASEVAAPTVTARSKSTLLNSGDRPHYLRGRLENGLFHSIGLQQSHALYGLSQANAMLRLEAGTTLAAGSVCQLMLI
jgi:molybdopterin molybdotransferase